MVGAIVLVIIAIASAVLGLVTWVTSQQLTTNSLIFWLIATVALSSALIIDGIRFYADKIATQMNYLLMPGRSAGSAPAPATPSIAAPARPSPSLSNSGAALAAGRGGARFRIVGKDRSSGMDTELVVQAVDQTAALRLGEQKGIDVSRVEPLA